MDKTKPYPGIAGLLDGLASRKIKMAILSNKYDDLTKRMVRTLLPRWDFVQVAGLTAEALKKPNPDEALRIGREIGIPPEKTLYAGDSGTDMQTANNAGMFAVGVLWGFRSKEELLSNGAKAVVEYPEDLLKML